jgi:hypothetical protein
VKTIALTGLRYVAQILVAISVAVFGAVAFFFLAFCDSGPIIICVLYMAAALFIPMLQLVGLHKAKSMLKQERRLPLSAGLMILVSLPPLVLACYFKFFA